VVFFVLAGVVWLRFRPREELELRWARDKKNAEGLVDYVDHGGAPGKVRGDLKKYQAAAKHELADAGAKPGAPIDALLDAMLAAVENRLVLEMPAAMVTTDRASFDAVAQLMAEPGRFVAPISHHLDEPGYDCAKGVAVVFKEALGNDVVDVEIARFIDDPDRGRPVLTIGWTARAGTSAYARANGKRIYPSMTVQAEMTLRAGDKVLATVKADARPEADIQYTTYGIMPAMDVMYPDSDSSDNDVYGGIVASTCEALGRQLMAQLTGVTAAAPAADDALAHDEKWCNEENDASSCARLGLRYRDGDGVPVDKAKAEELLHKSCREGLGTGAEACAAAAALSMEAAGDELDPMNDAQTRARMALMDGCEHHAADSCVALGRLRARPYKGEAALSEYSAREASLAYLHACDLGETAACLDASRLLATISPLRAMLLARRACAGGLGDACAAEKQLLAKAKAERKVHDLDLAKGDEPFDIHWATLFDGDETDAIWVASHDAPAALEARFRGELYKGTVIVNPAGNALPAPAWAKATYLVGAGPSIDYHQKCPPCPHASSSFVVTRCSCL
jgi:TPR repeat protein